MLWNVVLSGGRESVSVTGYKKNGRITVCVLNASNKRSTFGFGTNFASLEQALNSYKREYVKQLIKLAVEHAATLPDSEDY